MSEWKEYKLTEVGKLERGRSRHRPRYAFHLYGGPYPFVQTGEIRSANKYITSFNQTYSDAGLAQSRLWPAGTLCITIAANIAEIAILKFDACFPDSVIGFIPDEMKADLHFVFYTLKYFQKELQTFGDGSVQDNINLGTFEQIKFPFPPLPEQRAIASVLSSLDDKIDLLHRQNKTLEALAETLFRQWFVVEAEEEWEVKKVDDVAVFEKGRKPENVLEIQQEGLLPQILIETFDSGKVLFCLPQGMVLANENDILVVMDGASSGRVEIGFHGIVGSTIGVFKVRSDFPFPLFFYQFLKSNEEHIREHTTGSAIPHADKHLILGLTLTYPNKERVKHFESFADNLFQKRKSNRNEICTLTQLRDTLLPKLMSGEVRVKV